jgi:hypothetical protein
MIKAGDDLGNGLVAVPREPTDRMIEMAYTCLKRLPEDDRAKIMLLPGKDVHSIKMRARWTAMIEAASFVRAET